MEKILVVDDDLDLLALMQCMLIRSGFSVSSLSNAKDVFKVLQQFQPNLIILDINLGDADGRKICEEIKSIAEFQDLPIILYSAEEYPDLKIADCKASAFIKKPYSIATCNQTLLPHLLLLSKSSNN